MPSKKTQKDRVLSEDEINVFWHDLEYSTMSNEIKRALKLILVTGQRPGEVIGMHSREIDGYWWTIPAHRAKNGKGHRLYLTDFALELIGEKEGYVFESPKGDKPMENNAVACAVRRSLAEGKLTMLAWTPHDLRRTAATQMSILWFSYEIIDAMLNHCKKGVIGIYNRNKYDEEKQAALTCWACKLSNIITGKDAGCSKCPANQKANKEQRGQVVDMQAMATK
jgi:integrase